MLSRFLALARFRALAGFRALARFRALAGLLLELPVIPLLAGAALLVLSLWRTRLVTIQPWVPQGR